MIRVFVLALFFAFGNLIAGQRGRCSGYLKTSLIDNTGSFGNMFEVRTGEKKLKLNQIEFTTDLNTNVTFHVWAKRGSYAGHKSLEESWTKIAQGWTIGNGKDQPTPIPTESFSVVKLERETLYSFIVVLDTPNIRYNKGVAEGSIYNKTEYLSLLEGKGVAQFPPFLNGGFYMDKRNFAGRLIYTVVDDKCDEKTASPTVSPTFLPLINLVPPTPNPTSRFSKPTAKVLSKSPSSSKTEVKYKYLLELRNEQFDTVNAYFDSLVGIFFSDLFNLKGINKEDSQALSRIISVGETKYESVKSSYHFKENSNGYSCGESTQGSRCAELETVVSVTHNDDISDGEIRYFLLRFAERIQDLTSFDNIIYVGPRALKTKKDISLTNVTSDTFSQTENMEYFEKKLKMFLVDSLLDVSVASVVVTDYKGVNSSSGFRKRDRLLEQVVLGKRQRMHSSTSSDVTVLVTGEYQPPPKVDLGILVETSIIRNSQELVDMIKHGSNMNFKDIARIEVISEDDGDDKIDPQDHAYSYRGDDDGGNLSTTKSFRDYLWSRIFLIAVCLSLTSCGAFCFCREMYKLKHSRNCDDNTSSIFTNDKEGEGSMYGVLRQSIAFKERQSFALRGNQVNMGRLGSKGKTIFG